MKTPPRLWIIACWLMVLGGAIFLRFDHLSERPLHFDEATGARITSNRVEAGRNYQFNPVHNHGPLLSVAGAVSCWIHGETSWKEMQVRTLRLVPAVAGSLLVLLPLLWRRKFGDAPVLGAGALLATSPLLVYFSRMFIHEMLLTLLGVATLMVLCFSEGGSLKRKCFKWGGVGVLLGLMFATKESVAITVLAWMLAGVCLALEQRQRVRSIDWKKEARGYVWPMVCLGAAVVVTAGMFYTNGLRYPMGAWDAVRTFFVYQTESGHDKGLWYYFQMLAVPTKGGIWWFETPVLVLAVVAFLRSYRNVNPSSQQRESRKISSEILTLRFLAYGIVFHFLIYSAISYKTPWLMCLPWAFVCVLAGLSLRGFSTWRVPVKVGATIVFLFVVGWQWRTSVWATGRFASDVRNPYAYTPTSRDVEAVEQWLHELSKEAPSGSVEPVAVVGRYYWPLPWYLREFDRIGYWAQFPEREKEQQAIARCPVVFAMPETAPEVGALLKQTHEPFYRFLRADFSIMLYLRKDYWERWCSSE